MYPKKVINRNYEILKYVKVCPSPVQPSSKNKISSKTYLLTSMSHRLFHRNVMGLFQEGSSHSGMINGSQDWALGSSTTSIQSLDLLYLTTYRALQTHCGQS